MLPLKDFEALVEELMAIDRLVKAPKSAAKGPRSP
jgi:hypothetical protein